MRPGESSSEFSAKYSAESPTDVAWLHWCTSKLGACAYNIDSTVSMLTRPSLPPSLPLARASSLGLGAHQNAANAHYMTRGCSLVYDDREALVAHKAWNYD